VRHLLAIVTVLLVAPASAVASGFPATLTDALGQTVTVAARPVRIVSMAPSNTEILFAVGAGKQVAGVTSYCNYPPQARTKPQVGEFSRSSLESIVALQPDLVLAARFNPLDVLEAIRRLGIPVFAIAPARLDDVMDSMRQIGRLSGNETRADSLVLSLDRRIDRVRQITAALPDTARPVVLWGRLQAPMYTGGPGGYLHDLIQLAGGRNLAADAKTDWPQIGLETVVDRNPDVIIVSGGDANLEQDIPRLRQTDGWRQVRAVIDGRIHNLDADLLQRPGPRIVTGLEQLIRCIHPDLVEPDGR